MNERACDLHSVSPQVDACVSVEKSNYVDNGIDDSVQINATSIRRLSDSPMTEASLVIRDEIIEAFKDSHKIEVDTTAPKLDTGYGVRVNMKDRELYMGDEVNLYVQFDKLIKILYNKCCRYGQS